MNITHHFADWATYGNSAGPIRNAEMLNMWEPNYVLVFPGHSGTENMKAQAMVKGIEVRVISPSIASGKR